MSNTLTCDMERDCPHPVTHLDNKGWVYCAKQAGRRAMGTPTRKLTRAELAKLQGGEPIRYSRR